MWWGVVNIFEHFKQLNIFKRNKVPFELKILGILINSDSARKTTKLSTLTKQKTSQAYTIKKSITNTQTRTKNTQNRISRRDCDKAQWWERARMVLLMWRLKSSLFHVSFMRNFYEALRFLVGKGFVWMSMLFFL